MKTNLESVELTLRLWRQAYQTYTLLKKCEDQVFGEYGLTTEQYSVLAAIDYFGGPTKVTDIAHWLERSTNSISMIVDRMVKVGLVKRVRDKVDRRVVFVSNSSKGEKALKPATLAGLEVIRKILSPLSDEDRRTLISLLEIPKYSMLEHLNPGVNIKEVKRNELEQAANLKKWLSEYGLLSTPQAKRQGGKKKKNIQRE
jgi:MarR family 2-MHQ and catechol resistance regulon transcriptional repressor